MKKKFILLSFAAACLLLNTQKINAQTKLTTASAWQLTGNSGTSPFSNFVGTSDGSPLVFRTNNLERMRILKTGKIGIGTNNPTAKLNVVGESYVSLTQPGYLTLGADTGYNLTMDNSYIQARYNGNISPVYINYYGGVTNLGPSGIMKVSENGATLSAGNFNFTTGSQYIQFGNPVSSPSPMMYMFSSGTVNLPRMVIAHSPANPDWGLQYTDNGDQFDFIGSGNSKLHINLASGNIGIGTTNPSGKLDVVGNETLEGNLTFTTGTQSIQFANPGTSPSPMMYMFASGTTNTTRMVIAHSPGFPTWGLQYADNGDQFDFLGAGTSRMSINLSNGNVGIGVTSPAYKLEVCGTIRAKEVRVETGWCDYVFEKNYKLRTLDELEQYINENKHLPGIAPASEVEKDGLKVAEMNKAMMEKIEELTLYVIQLDKENKKLQEEIDELKKK